MALVLPDCLYIKYFITSLLSVPLVHNTHIFLGNKRVRKLEVNDFERRSKYDLGFRKKYSLVTIPPLLCSQAKIIAERAWRRVLTPPPPPSPPQHLVR